MADEEEENEGKDEKGMEKTPQGQTTLPHIIVRAYARCADPRKGI